MAAVGALRFNLFRATSAAAAGRGTTGRRDGREFTKIGSRPVRRSQEHVKFYEFLTPLSFGSLHEADGGGEIELLRVLGE